MQRKKLILILGSAVLVLAMAIGGSYLYFQKGTVKAPVKEVTVMSEAIKQETDYEWVDYLLEKMKVITSSGEVKSIQRSVFTGDKLVQWLNELPGLNKFTGRYSSSAKIPLLFDGVGPTYTDKNTGKENEKILWNFQTTGSETAVTEMNFSLEAPDRINPVNIEKIFSAKKLSVKVIKNYNAGNFSRRLYEVALDNMPVWVDFSWNNFQNYSTGKFNTNSIINVYFNKSDVDKVPFPNEYNPATQFGKVSKADSALLLGVKTSDNYYTYWIYPEDGLLKVKRGTGYIVAPYGDAFWKITRNVLSRDDSKKRPTGSYNPWGVNIRYFSVNLLEKAATKLNAETYMIPEGFVYDYRDDNIVFIGNKYAVMDRNIRLNRAVDKSFVQNYTNVYTIDKIGLDEANVKLPELLTENKDTFSSYALTPKLEYIESPAVKALVKNNFENTAAGNDLTVIRENARFVAKLKIKRLGTEPFYLPVQSSIADINGVVKDLFGYNEFKYGWDKMQREYLDVEDALQSPDDTLVVAVQSGRLVFYELRDGKLNLVSSHLMGDGTIISAQWATGQYVKKWVAEMAKLNMPDYPLLQNMP